MILKACQDPDLGCEIKGCEFRSVGREKRLGEAAMPIVRCPACIAGCRPSYRVHAEPVGYPKTDIVCGAPGCEEPGLVWL